VAALAEHFCAELSSQNDRPGMKLDSAAVELLEKQSWPGNVRQLQNYIERLVVMSEGDVIAAEDVRRELERQPDIAAAPAGEPETGGDVDTANLRSRRSQAEREAVLKALRRANQNRTVAARILGVSRRTLYNKLQEFGLA
jgi:DNA-binding NtrC family response regulator